MNNPTYEPINESLDFPATKEDIKNLASKTDLELLRQDINDKFASLPTVEDFRQLLSTVDKLVGQVSTYNTERNAEAHRLERLESWAGGAAETINVPIEF
jgi:hypothetical protein